MLRVQYVMTMVVTHVMLTSSAVNVVEIKSSLISEAGMLILGLKAKFLGLGLGTVRPWP